MNRILIAGIALVALGLGAGGVWAVNQAEVKRIAQERDAALARAAAIESAAPAPEAFQALETENAQLKVRLDEMRIQLSAAQAAPAASAAAPEVVAEASVDLEDLLGAMAWGEGDEAPRRGGRGDGPAGASSGDAATEAGAESTRPGGEGRGPWGDPARREEFAKRGAVMREAMHNYLEEEAAKTSQPEAQERLAVLSDQLNEMQQIRDQLRGLDDSPERDALREQLRVTQDAMRQTVREQQRYLLEEAVIQSGVENPGQARQVANTVRQTLNSPFFQMEPMLRSGRDRDRRPPSKPAQ
jgi:hypothetical protein